MGAGQLRVRQTKTEIAKKRHLKTTLLANANAQMQMFQRGMEIMEAQVVLAGQIQISPDAYESQPITIVSNRSGHAASFRRGGSVQHSATHANNTSFEEASAAREQSRRHSAFPGQHRPTSTTTNITVFSVDESLTSCVTTAAWLLVSSAVVVTRGIHTHAHTRALPFPLAC